MEREGKGEWREGREGEEMGCCKVERSMLGNWVYSGVDENDTYSPNTTPYSSLMVPLLLGSPWPARLLFP